MSHTIARCANRHCRTTVHPDWDADSCPGGHVVTCLACDPVEACDECREVAS